MDDDSDTVCGESVEAVESLLQSEVQNSVEWLSDNRLCTAADKSKTL